MAILPLEHAEGVRQRATFIKTPTAKKIIDFALVCCQHGKIGVVVGAPGTGKTATCAHLKREMGWSVVSLTPSTGTLRSGLSSVLEGISDGEATEYEYARRKDSIRRRLWELLEHIAWTMLIIDEAQHARDDLLEELRCLHDESAEAPGLKPRLGLLLVGNPTVLSRMYKDKPKFMHLISRFGLKPLILKAPEAGDVHDICVEFGVKDRESLGLIEKLSARGGGLRAVANALEFAAAAAGNAPISPAGLRQAIECVEL